MTRVSSWPRYRKKCVFQNLEILEVRRQEKPIFKNVSFLAIIRRKLSFFNNGKIWRDARGKKSFSNTRIIWIAGKNRFAIYGNSGTGNRKSRYWKTPEDCHAWQEKAILENMDNLARENLLEILLGRTHNLYNEKLLTGIDRKIKPSYTSVNPKGKFELIGGAEKMKIARKTIERVVKEKICDVGKYRYNLVTGMAGSAKIERRKISELNVLPKYGPAWETVARYNTTTEEWEVE